MQSEYYVMHIRLRLVSIILKESSDSLVSA